MTVLRLEFTVKQKNHYFNWLSLASAQVFRIHLISFYLMSGQTHKCICKHNNNTHSIHTHRQTAGLWLTRRQTTMVIHVQYTFSILWMKALPTHPLGPAPNVHTRDRSFLLLQERNKWDSFLVIATSYIFLVVIHLIFRYFKKAKSHDQWKNCYQVIIIIIIIIIIICSISVVVSSSSSVNLIQYLYHHTYHVSHRSG